MVRWVRGRFSDSVWGLPSLGGPFRRLLRTHRPGSSKRADARGLRRPARSFVQSSRRERSFDGAIDLSGSSPVRNADVQRPPSEAQASKHSAACLRPLQREVSGVQIPAKCMDHGIPDVLNFVLAIFLKPNTVVG